MFGVLGYGSEADQPDEVGGAQLDRLIDVLLEQKANLDLLCDGHKLRQRSYHEWQGASAARVQTSGDGKHQVGLVVAGVELQCRSGMLLRLLQQCTLLACAALGFLNLQAQSSEWVACDWMFGASAGCPDQCARVPPLELIGDGKCAELGLKQHQRLSLLVRGVQSIHFLPLINRSKVQCRLHREEQLGVTLDGRERLCRCARHASICASPVSRHNRSESKRPATGSSNVSKNTSSSSSIRLCISQG